MDITFNTETIRIINLFEKLTGVQIKDCLTDEDSNVIYLIVKEGKVGIAIGKNGSTIKHVEKLMKRRIKVFEFSNDLATFVKNIIPQSQEVKIKNEVDGINVEIKVDRNDKAIIIGRDGRNLKIYKEILQRCHKVNNLTVR